MSAYLRKIAPRFTWDDNPLNKKVLEQLDGICKAIKKRHEQRKKGTIVIFSGLPGTGKIIAAEVVANDLCLNLYRINLSAVVSKYIGETEKNLRDVFDEAAVGSEILFFDEADALFGERREVKDAHDRYANIEISYLFQRIKAYEGIVIFATNGDVHFEGAFRDQVLYPLEFPRMPFRGSQTLAHAYPNIYIDEVPDAAHPIAGISTSVAAFIGKTAGGDIDMPTRVSSWNEFVDIFGGYNQEHPHLAAAVYGFFDNGGKECRIVRIRDDGLDDDYIGKGEEIGMKTGLQAIEDFKDVSIVCIPGVTSERVQCAALEHCETLRDRFCILDAEVEADIQGILAQKRKITSAKGYGAIYYPWIKAELEINTSGQSGRIQALVPPSGHIAGIFARTDRERGVHKAPANCTIRGAIGAEKTISSFEQDILNPEGINCIRIFPGRGPLVWGARTVATDPEWKYISVRRFIIFLEHSIQEGTQWVVFEPNIEATWRKLRRTVDNFLIGQWRSGALQGRTPEQAFFVRCDRTTMTQIDIDSGRMVCLVGVALLKPAEFLVLRIVRQV
jgi:phage tail sheath protein FI